MRYMFLTVTLVLGSLFSAGCNQQTPLQKETKYDEVKLEENEKPKTNLTLPEEKEIVLQKSLKVKAPAAKILPNNLIEVTSGGSFSAENLTTVQIEIAFLHKKTGKVHATLILPSGLGFEKAKLFDWTDVYLVRATYTPGQAAPQPLNPPPPQPKAKKK